MFYAGVGDWIETYVIMVLLSYSIFRVVSWLLVRSWASPLCYILLFPTHVSSQYIA